MEESTTYNHSYIGVLSKLTNLDETPSYLKDISLLSSQAPYTWQQPLSFHWNKKSHLHHSPDPTGKAQREKDVSLSLWSDAISPVLLSSSRSSLFQGDWVCEYYLMEKTHTPPRREWSFPAAPSWTVLLENSSPISVYFPESRLLTLKNT